MLNKEFIRGKLNLISNYYKDLEEILSIPLPEIKKSSIRLYALERVFQLIVDEIVDINTHIIRHSSFNIPDEFQSTFIILAENNILSEEFAKKIAPVVGLRNRLVHRYEKIDKELFLKIICEQRGDFRKYVNSIEEYIGTLEKKAG